MYILNTAKHRSVKSKLKTKIKLNYVSYIGVFFFFFFFFVVIFVVVILLYFYRFFFKIILVLPYLEGG